MDVKNPRMETEEDEEKHGSPHKRWVGDIRTVAGKKWMRSAKNRERSKQLGETYIEEWIR